MSRRKTESVVCTLPGEKNTKVELPTKQCQHLKVSLTNHKKNAKKPRSFMVYLTRNHMKKAGYWGQKIVKNKMNDTENVGSILHPASILHPILHRKSPMYKGIFIDGCRNVGENQKTFFWGVGFGNAKHRTSLRQTSVLSRQNNGTLPQRSPMFLISERAANHRRISVHQKKPVPQKNSRNHPFALDAECLLWAIGVIAACTPQMHSRRFT